MVRAIGLAAGLMLGTAGTSFTLAQAITHPDSIPKNAFIWDQEERELGFRYFDEVFEARLVPRGDQITQVPAGKPIWAFAGGGEKEAEFQAFLSEQKLAGLLIMQDGKIRMEHYGLGLSREGRWKESYTEPDSDLFGLFTTPIDSGMDQIVSYMRTLPAEAEPGKKWNYSTGETHLLGTLMLKDALQRINF